MGIESDFPQRVDTSSTKVAATVLSIVTQFSIKFPPGSGGGSSLLVRLFLMVTTS